MRHLLFGVMTVLLLTSVSATFGAEAARVADDWVQIDKLLTEREFFLYQSEFDKNPEIFAEKWILFKAEFLKRESEFKNRYGSERNGWMEAFDGVVKPDGVQRENYAIVNEFLNADIEGLHQTISAWAESTGSEQLGNWERLVNPDSKQVELKYRYAKRALAAYRIAAKLQPGNDYSERIGKCEAAEKETRAQFVKTMETLKWPGHNGDFTGPGKPKELAEAALEFLRNNPQWSKPEYDDVHIPYAACVNGSAWEIWKKNPLTEAPTQYSIDMLVAFAGEKDPDIVYVYSMVFYTAEEEGIEKGLPFRYANSKQYQKYQMLKKSVPEGVSAKKAKPSEIESSAAGGVSEQKQPPGGGARQDESPEEDGGSAGSAYWGWRLLFSLILTGAGCMAARSSIVKLLPAVKSITDKASGWAAPIGIAILALGFLGFVGNLIRFQPHASLLPQLTAIALGLLFLGRTPGILPADITQKLQMFEARQTPLGLAGILFGLLHLILGGLPLL